MVKNWRRSGGTGVVLRSYPVNLTGWSGDREDDEDEEEDEFYLEDFSENDGE